MKNVKRIMAIILCLGMLLCLTGCSSFELKMLKTARAMSKIESLHADVTANMIVGMGVTENKSLTDKSLDMELTANCGADVRLKPAEALLEIELESIGVDSKYDIYAALMNDGVRVYVSHDDGQWKEVSMTPAGSANAQIDTDTLLEYARECAKSFKKTGEESVMGLKATRFDGLVSQATVQSVLNQLGWDESEAVEGDIPVSLWIDNKSDMIVRCDIDLSQVSDSLTGLISKNVSVNIGDFNFGFGLETRELKLSVMLSKFDEVEDIEVPWAE